MKEKRSKYIIEETDKPPWAMWYQTPAQTGLQRGREVGFTTAEQSGGGVQIRKSLATRNRALEVPLPCETEELESHKDTQREGNGLDRVAGHCKTHKNHPRKRIPQAGNTENRPAAWYTLALTAGELKQKIAGPFTGIMLSIFHL